MKQQKTAFRGAVWAALALAALALPASAQDLFRADAGRVSDTERALDPSYRAIVDSPATNWMQLVDADAALVTERATSLVLNLGLDLDLVAYRLDAYSHPWGSTVWAGAIADLGQPRRASADGLHFDAMNTVTIVRDGAQLTGNVHYGGEWYKIRPLTSGGHAIVRVDMARMPADHPAEFRDLPHVAMKEVEDTTKAISTIRVMVNYTPAAASAAGNISSLIDLAVAETNQGYSNSGVEINMVLANKSQTTYTESSSFSTDLSRYRSTTDSYMTAIHTTRNSTTADVAVLLINNASSCGLASGIGSTASTAFAVAHWDCATGYYSFGHEIGHLQSARHDPATDPTNSPYTYGHGFQNNVSPTWRTIMAYACSGSCPRLNYWSNPAKTYNGRAMGTTNRSHNQRVLNLTKATVAAFR
jgi:hypothetical protein